jgi:hypothetical protein
VKYLQDKVTSGDKEDALLATRALGERRDPAVLPFALKIARDPKADKALRDEMFGVVEGIGGLGRGEGAARDHLVGQGRDRPLPRVRVDPGGAQGRRHPAGLEAFPASASYKKVDVDDLLVKLIEKQGRRPGRR